MTKRASYIIIIFALGFISMQARPQYSILQTYGAKCTSCHLDNQGGVRSFQGWMSRKDISLVKPEWIGLQGFFNNVTTSNTVLDDKVLFGEDFRYQEARFGPVDNSTREYLVMQLNPHLVITPIKGLEFHGSYNFAYDLEDLHRYPHQQQYTFTTTVKPWENLPYLKIGYFKPYVGTKYDDHTMLVNRMASNQRSLPLIPHDYAEFGAELEYESLSWLGASLGAFTTDKLSQVIVSNYLTNKIPLVNPNTLSYNMRLVFTPEIFEGWSAYMGGTMFFNTGKGIDGKDSYFYVFNLFCNIGLTDKLALMTEYCTSEKQFTSTTDNILLELDYQVTDAIIPYIRAERGTTRQRVFQDDVFYNVNQYVFGASINVLPFIKLLPEYRIYDREAAAGNQTQWAVQLHVFY
jgi:hypothetical protein